MEDIGGGGEGLSELLARAGELKKVRREGWFKVGISNPESVADHSYRTTLIAMLAAESEGLDALKCMKVALIHDLAESVVGDITPDEAEAKGKAKLEDLAMRGILAGADLQPYLALWNELRDGSSPEAKLVLDADKIEMWLQAVEYERGTGVDLTEFRLSAEAAIRSDAGRRLLAILQKEEGEG